MSVPVLPEFDVSVVVATYRREVDLKRALESIGDQTHRSIQVVVVDDNAESTWNERVQAVVRDVGCRKHLSVVYLCNDVRCGSAVSRNRGIEFADGEYVTFLDDDDVYLPEKVQRQLAHMKDADSDYSITDLELVSESGRLVERRRRRYLDGCTADSLLRAHYMHHITGTDTIMFRKNYLCRIGGFPQIPLGDEFHLVERAIRAGGRFSYLPVCDVRATVHTRTHGKSSGQAKIDGENALYLHKTELMQSLDRRAVSYITMRHWLVLSFAELRHGRLRVSLWYALRALIASPVQMLRLIIQSR